MIYRFYPVEPRNNANMGSSCSSKSSNAVVTPAPNPPVSQQQTNGSETGNTKILNSSGGKHAEINSNIPEIDQADSNKREEETTLIQDATDVKGEPGDTTEEKKDEVKPGDPVKSEQDPPIINNHHEPPSVDEAEKRHLEGEVKDEARHEPEGAPMETKVEEENGELQQRDDTSPPVVPEEKDAVVSEETEGDATVVGDGHDSTPPAVAEEDGTREASDQHPEEMADDSVRTEAVKGPTDGTTGDERREAESANDEQAGGVEETPPSYPSAEVIKQQEPAARDGDNAQETAEE